MHGDEQLSAGQTGSKRLRGLALAGVCVLVLGACEGVLKPHPRSDLLRAPLVPKNEPSSDRSQQDPGKGNSGEAKDDGPPKFHGDLPAAIDAVNHQRKKYLLAGDNIASWRGAGAFTLIGLSASALFLGITSDSRSSRDAITAMGLAGAGLLGLDSFYISKPRQRLYYQAAGVLSCAAIAMRPFLVTEDDYGVLDKQIEPLDRLRLALAGHIQAVEVLKADLEKRSPRDPAILRANADIVVARSTIDEADQVRAKAILLKGQIDTAGTHLRLTVQRIVSEVDVQIAATEPDLRSVLASINGLAGLAGQIAPSVSFEVPPVAAAPAAAGATPSVLGLESKQGKKDQETTLKLVEDFEKRLAQLNATNRDLVVQIALVRPVVDQAAQLDRTVSALDTCQVPDADVQFAVTPDVTSLQADAGSTLLFEVNNNIGMPTVAFAGRQPAGSTADMQISGGAYQAVVVLGDQATGEVALVFRNGSRTAEKVIKVVIKPKGQDAQGRKNGASDNGIGIVVPPTDTKTLIPLQVATLQVAVETDVDGIIGPRTRIAIAKFRQARDMQDNGGIDDELWTAVKTLLSPEAPDPAAIVKPQTDAERSLTPDDIGDLQTAIGRLVERTVVATGSFDLETRTAIVEFQKRADLPQTGTILHAKILELMTGCPKLPDCR